MQYLIYLFLLINPTSSKYKILTWDDFKGTAQRSDLDGNSIAGTCTEWTMIDSIDDGRAYFNLRCDFIPGKSWTLTNDSGVLVHEQTHLYISIFNSEKFRNVLSKYQGANEKNEQKVIKLFNYWWKESENLQKLYDKETQHGLNKAMQKTWEEMIFNDLKTIH